MFELVDVEDHIPLPAPTFPKELAAFPLCSTSSQTATSPTDSSSDTLTQTRARFRNALLSAIASKFLFRVVPDVGFAVSIASLLQVADDVHLLPGQSKVWVHCSFTLIVFKPQVGDRLRARIVEQDAVMGIRLSVEFFDQIVVPPHRLVEGSEWEPTIRQWGIRDETGSFIRYVNNNVVVVQQQSDMSKKNGGGTSFENSNSNNVDGAQNNNNNTGEGGGDPKSPVATIPTTGSDSLVSSSSSLLVSKQQQHPGSVVCVIDKVNVVSSSDEQQQQQANANIGSSLTSASALGTSSSNSNMRIFASFNVCDGLGPEAWFAEEEQS